MADKKKKVEKEPGRIKQLWQVLNLTRKTDKLLVPILILTFLAPLGAGTVSYTHLTLPTKRIV